MFFVPTARLTPESLLPAPWLSFMLCHRHNDLETLLEVGLTSQELDAVHDAIGGTLICERYESNDFRLL